MPRTGKSQRLPRNVLSLIRHVRTVDPRLAARTLDYMLAYKRMHPPLLADQYINECVDALEFRLAVGDCTAPPRTVVRTLCRASRFWVVPLRWRYADGVVDNSVRQAHHTHSPHSY